MATYQTEQVRAGRVFSDIAPKNQVQTVCGVFSIATALAQNDTIELVELPAGATVVGGQLRATDIDTGTEALDIDVGVPGDADAFGNLGIWTGDTNNTFPLAGELFVSGPQHYSAKTKIILTCNAAANAGGTGKVWIVVEYIVE